MKAKKILAFVFLCVIGFFFSLVTYKLCFRAVEKATGEEREIVIDWEKLYPFEAEEGKHYSPKKEKSNNLVVKLYYYLKKRFEENTSSKKLIGYYSFVECAKKYEDIINWNMVAMDEYNPVIKLRDGYLSSFVMSSDISSHAEAVIKFSKFCEKTGSDFCYINLPFKICKSEDKDISGVLDFSNQNVDRFLARFDEAGVKNYDIRKMLHDDAMKHHESFFITDHHWKPETGLWAAAHILKILRDDFAYDVRPEILAPENFERVIYHDWFLGSHGKKLTLLRVKPEDISLIYPKFDTLINFQIPTQGINTSGDFSITYEMKDVAVKDYYHLNPYGAYKYADLPLSVIRNVLNNNNKRLLIFHDSLSNCVIPFLALGVHEIFESDLRHFTGSVKNLIKSIKPDMVIVMYGSSHPGSTKEIDKQLYDFR